MKKNFLFIITIVLFACSKGTQQNVYNSTTIAPPPPPPPPPIRVSYPIDVNFDLNAYCGFEYDDSQVPQGSMGKYLYFTAWSSNLLNGSNDFSDILLSQLSVIQGNFYYYPLIRMAEKNNGNNYFWLMVPISQTNFFTLPYANGPAPFSGVAAIRYGHGRFINIDTTSLNYSGFMDTTNSTGSIRIQGTLSY